MYKWLDNKKSGGYCMRMKNNDVVSCFVNQLSGAATNHSKSLRVEGTKLFNYYTIIGQYVNGTLFINATKYSSTTSTIQNKLKREAFQRHEYVELLDIPQDTHDLSKYASKFIAVS